MAQPTPCLLYTSGVSVAYLDVEGKEVKAFSNDMVWLHDFVDCNEEELGIYERVRFSVLRQLMEEHQGQELLDAIRENVDELIPKHIIVDDILASINYLNCLANGVGTADDIDHLGNRRLRSVGELLQNQFRIGFSRMAVSYTHLDVYKRQKRVCYNCRRRSNWDRLCRNREGEWRQKGRATLYGLSLIHI